MCLLAYWEEGKREILAAYAFVTLKEISATYTCLSCKEKLSLKKEHLRFYNSKQEFVWVIPHFCHSPESACKEAGESQEHYEKKLVLLSYLYCNKININFSGLTLFIDENQIKGKEITRGENRADVLIEFKKFNPLFGNGIVFEIMKSEDYQSIETKEKKWLEKGYYVIPIKAFELQDIAEKGIEITESIIAKQKKELENIFSKVKLLLYQATSPEYQVLFVSKSENNCKNCKRSSIDRLNKNILCCWFFKEYSRFPDKRDSQQICNFWSGK